MLQSAFATTQELGWMAYGGILSSLLHLAGGRQMGPGKGGPWVHPGKIVPGGEGVRLALST